MGAFAPLTLPIRNPDSVLHPSIPFDVFVWVCDNYPHTAMISALKALQDKIHSLELERVAAADKFRHLAHETQQHARGTKRAVLVEGGSPLLPSSHTSPLPGYPSSPSPDQEGNCVISNSKWDTHMLTIQFTCPNPNTHPIIDAFNFIAITIL